MDSLENNYVDNPTCLFVNSLICTYLRELSQTK